MYELICLRFYQFLEFRESGSVFASLKQRFFSTEEIVPVKKKLSGLKETTCVLNDSHLSLVVLTADTLNDHKYRLKSREARARVYFKKGYECFGLVRGNVVVGEVWFSEGTSEQTGKRHPMADLLNLNITPREVYMFDLFVSSTERGKSTTTCFMNRALEEIKLRGYESVYGCFTVDNVPALWVHRIIGYEELPHLIITRRFFKETAKSLKTKRLSGNQEDKPSPNSQGLLSSTNSETIGR